MRVAVALLLCAVAAPVSAQPVQPAPQAVPAAPFAKAEAHAAVEALARLLEDNFVDPKVAALYANGIRAKLAAGAYDRFATQDAFARAVTADLQAVAPDAHLRMFSPAAAEMLKTGPRPSGGKRRETFIEKSGWIAPGVAYIGFFAFMGDAPTLNQLRAFLAEHANAKTLIIDTRNHHGGELDEMDLMFAQLYAKPTELLVMDTREAVARRAPQLYADTATVKRAAAPATVVRQIHSAIPAAAATPLREAKVIVLTSRNTASAGEHFALALQRTGRATLVGEKTYGAGNYGDPFALPGGYSAFIPVGTTFDPDTARGWEGTGVTPDVAVSADEALAKALELAGVKADAKVALAGMK